MNRSTDGLGARARLMAKVSTLGAVAMFGAACIPETPAPPPPEPTPEVTSFVFSGGGFGHGIGMSQYGAQGRALAGHSYSQILTNYYPGTSLATQQNDGPSVLIGNSSSTNIVVKGGSLYAGLSGDKTKIASAGDTVRFRRTSNSIYVKRLSPTAGTEVKLGTSEKVYVTWSSSATIKSELSGHNYKYGRLVLVPASGKIDFIVDSMTMNEYLYGLGEVPMSWAAAAQQAQAVTGRTFAARKIASPRSGTYDMLDNTYDQNWVGWDQGSSSYFSRWKSAVDTTKDKVLKSGSSLAQTYYSSSNGGYSEKSSYVWYADISYLQAVKDPYDKVSGNSNHSWTETYSRNELSFALTAAGYGVGFVDSVSISGNVGKSGRVDKASIKLKGTEGTKTITGNQLRFAINAAMPFSRDLLSTKFTVKAKR